MVLYWSSLSDCVGRKPVLLVGMFGDFPKHSGVCWPGMFRFSDHLSINEKGQSRCLTGALSKLSDILFIELYPMTLEHK